MEESQQQQQQQQQQRDNVVSLKNFHDVNLSEDSAKAIFSMYDSLSYDSWSYDDVRNFLCDLLLSFNHMPVVPNEAVTEVIQEIHNSDGEVITWVEFKAYSLYLQQRPLHELHGIVQRYSTDELCEWAVIVRRLPAQATLEHVLAYFNEKCDGSVQRVFVVSENSTTEAFVSFRDTNGRQAAIALNGTRMLESEIDVQVYNGQKFPSLSQRRQPSAVARGVAKVYVGVKNVDEKLQVSTKVKEGVKYVGEKLDKLAEEHQIQAKVASVKESASGKVKELDEKMKISEKAKDVDNKYQITATASAASHVVRHSVNQLLENENVQKATNFLRDMSESVRKSLTDFQEDTAAAIEAEKAKNADHSFEMSTPQQ